MGTDRIQAALADAKLDGWLFFDHHRRDSLAYRILGIPDNVEPTRRWYYFVPAVGEPRKLVHRIETGALDTLPGEKNVYASWADQQEKLAFLLRGASRIAMQYSRNCAIPYVSLVDAGTLELVRGCGVEVVSSADLVQLFEARWSEDQFQSHLRAGKLVDQVRRSAFGLVGERLGTNEPVSEYEVQQFIRRRFLELGLTTNHGPIVAVNEHASDPHYEPNQERSSQIHSGDLLLIDMWAKLMEPDAVYYDITWTGYCGETIPSKMQKVFQVVRDARKQASQFVIRKASKRAQFAGYEVDDVARGFIKDQGFGEYFFHRTGHSIGTEVHGTGANMDNLESHDDRSVISGTCFSIEPGLYLPEFGIRSEVNVYVGDGFAQVTGEEQEQLIRI
ncbi:MAG TPA: M24 family metallopeptidase [Bryobacteraceae bacterium]|jgi:Xaa-Pro aminopeptidase|nr:M24 family metallopeptidase [Bryobacteraceae bacterium]